MPLTTINFTLTRDMLNGLADAMDAVGGSFLKLGEACTHAVNNVFSAVPIGVADHDAKKNDYVSVTTVGSSYAITGTAKTEGATVKTGVPPGAHTYPHANVAPSFRVLDFTRPAFAELAADYIFQKFDIPPCDEVFVTVTRSLRDRTYRIEVRMFGFGAYQDVTDQFLATERDTATLVMGVVLACAQQCWKKVLALTA